MFILLSIIIVLGYNQFYTLKLCAFLIEFQTQTLTNIFSKVFPFYFYIGIQTQTKIQ